MNMYGRLDSVRSDVSSDRAAWISSHQLKPMYNEIEDGPSHAESPSSDATTFLQRPENVVDIFKILIVTDGTEKRVQFQDLML